MTVQVRPKVWLLGPMNYTPFDKGAALAQIGFDLARSAAEADVLLTKTRNQFPSGFVDPKQKHIVWTHEPYFDRTQGSVDMKFLKNEKKRVPLYVFNAHNGLIYTDNFYYGPRGSILPLLESEADLNTGFDDKTISMAATAANKRLTVGCREISLYAERRELALALCRLGMIRIIGSGWPDGVARQESSLSDRIRSKSRFLRSSNFNLCYENSLVDFYVTEKLWDAIGSGCLPIYRGGSALAANFPKDSLLDGADFPTAEALADYVRAMPFDEFRFRVNRCRDVYNHAATQRLRAASRARAVDRFQSHVTGLYRPRGGARRAEPHADASLGAPAATAV